MFWLIFTSVAIICLNQVVADNHGCVTKEKTDSVNNLILQLTSGLSSILNSQDAEDVIMGKVLSTICNKTESNEAYKNVKDIETLIGECRALAQYSEVANITLGALEFKDMFERFSGVDNFCDCTPTLSMAMAMNSYTTSLTVNTGGVKYPYIKVSLLCSDNTAKMAVKTVATNLKMCPEVWRYADLLNEKNVVTMNTFAENECSKLVEANFTCAVEQSKTDTFKTCISEADKMTGDDDLEKKKMCARRKCATENTCGSGSVWYMWAVNMEKNGLDTFSLTECTDNGVASTLASISVILFGTLFTMLLY